MRELTDDEVVRILATREEWRFKNPRNIAEGFLGCNVPVFDLYREDSHVCGSCNMEAARHFGLPDYLHSLDAQAPLLEKLTDEEWDRVEYGLNGAAPHFIGVRAKCYLTLPARSRAYAIARAIGKKA